MREFSFFIHFFKFIDVSNAFLANVEVEMCQTTQMLS